MNKQFMKTNNFCKPLYGASALAISDDKRLSRLFILVVVIYFLLQIVLRLSLSDALDLDEAEQVFVSQNLQLGYETQPPLYAWLQFLFFSAFGVNLFALSLLKNLLLFASYIAIFFTAKEMIGVRGAIAAAASMLMLPAIGWEAQRDLTHSVLLLAMAALTLLAYSELLKRPDVWRYALLGVMLGLGLQSKYNFGIFATGLAVASLTVAEHRRIVWNAKLMLTALVGAVVLMPHCWWLVQNVGEASHGTLAKMNKGEQQGYLRNVLTGAGSLFEAAIAFITPLWLVYAWIGRRHFKKLTLSDSVHARFFSAMIFCFLGVLIMMLLTGKVTHVKSRWLMPLLFVVPLAFFVLVPQFASADIYRKVSRCAAVFALIVLLALPLRVYVGPMLGKDVRAHFPYPELSQTLVHKFPHLSAVLTDSQLTAGNLHFQLPSVKTYLLRDVDRSAGLDGQVVLLTRAGAAENWRARFLSAHPHAIELQRGRFDLPMNYGSERDMSFEFVQFTLKDQ